MKKIAAHLGKDQVLGLVLAVVIAYAITAIIFLATAIILTYTTLSEDTLPTIVMATCVISVLFAGFDASKKATSRGWLWGIIAGLLYAIIFIFIIAFIGDTFTFDTRKFLLLALSLVGGGIGGAIGINFKKR